MQLSIDKKAICRFISAVMIIGFYAFSEYSSYVYGVKIVGIVALLALTRYAKKNMHLHWIVSFVGFEVISMAWAYSQKNTMFYIAWTLQAMLLSYAIGNTIRDRHDIEFYLKTIMFAGLFLSLRVIAKTSISNLGAFRLGSNLGYNANELALKSAISCIIAFFFFLKSNKKNEKLLYFLFTGILLLTVFLTGSRKGSVMAIIGIAFFLVLKSKTPLIRLRNIFIAFLAVIGFFVLITKVEFLYNVLGHRLLLLLNMFEEGAYVGNSIGNRMNFIDIGMELFKANPIIGYGIGNFPVVSGVGLYAHNNYVELLVDLGVIGFCIYYFFYFVNIFQIIKLFRKNNELFGLFLSFILMIMILEYGLVSFQSDYIQLLLALSVAAIQYYSSQLDITEELSED